MENVDRLGFAGLADEPTDLDEAFAEIRREVPGAKLGWRGDRPVGFYVPTGTFDGQRIGIRWIVRWAV